MRVGAQCDLELTAEDQVLEHDISARSNGSKDCTENEEQEFEHSSE